ncbi:MAG: LysM peptidoglycan-binding domain-containing protein [Planctomycetales bacterium]
MADPNPQAGHSNPSRGKGESPFSDSQAAGSAKKALKPTDAFPETDPPEEQDDAAEEGKAAEKPKRKAGSSSRFQTIFSISMIVCLLGTFGVVCYLKYRDRIDKGLLSAKDKIVAQATRLKDSIRKKKPGESTAPEEDVNTEKDSTAGTEPEESGVAKLTDEPPAEDPPAKTAKTEDSENPFADTEKTAPRKEQAAAEPPGEMPKQDLVTEEIPETKQPARIKAEQASVAQLKSPIPEDEGATLQTPQSDDPMEEPKKTAESPASLKEVVEDDPGYSRNRLASAPPMGTAPPKDDFMEEIPRKKEHVKEPVEEKTESRPTGILTEQNEELGRYRPLETGSSEASSRTRIRSSVDDNLPPAHPTNEEPPVARKEARDEFDPEPVPRRVENLKTPAKEKTLPRHPRENIVREEKITESAAAPADGQTYVIKPHDNYWKISKQQYGSARYFTALARFNQERIPDPQMMKPGMKIVVPAKEVLERQFPDLFQEQKLKAEQEKQEQGPRFFRDAKGGLKYRVGSEDNLSTISQRYLGKSSRWDEIYQLNQELLKDADSLRVGTVLDLPGDASPQRMAKEPQDFR